MIVVVEPHNAEKHSSFARTDVSHAGTDFSRSLGLGCRREGRRGTRQIRRAKSRLHSLYRRGRTQGQRQPASPADHRPNPGGRFLFRYAPGCGEPHGAEIWECTRFCLDEKVWQKKKEEILFASTVLLVALGDLALLAGIESIIGNFDAAALHLWRRIGCEVEILGSTSRYGRPVYLGLHPISETVISRIKKKLKGAQSAFAEARVMAA